MARIRIDDLPPAADLTPEELERIYGAGRPPTRLGIERLEDRELFAANVTANLVGGLLKVEGTKDSDVIAIRRIDKDHIGVFSGDQQTLIKIDGRDSVLANEVTKIDVRTLAGHDRV